MAARSTVGGRRLLALLDQAAEPIIVLDAKDRVVFVNAAWQRLTGLTAETVEGVECRPADAGPEGSTAQRLAAFCPPVEVRRGESARTRVLVAGGSESQDAREWHSAEFWPLHDATGVRVAILGVIGALDGRHSVPEAPSHRLRSELWALREEHRTALALDLVGQGPAHERLLSQVVTAAATESTVLIVGEAGSGKRTVARAIHRKSARAAGPFEVLDASALGAEELERVLFESDPADLPSGLARGDETTVVVGDLRELPRDVQARIVSSCRDGGLGAKRLIFLTCGDVEAALRGGQLRSDLYYAATGLVIALPPLRDRLDELPLFAQRFLEMANLAVGTRRFGFTPAALDVLRGYDWPGNLAELARVVQAAVGASDGDLVTPEDLPAVIQGHYGASYTPPRAAPAVTSLDETLQQVERTLIERALLAARQRKSRASEMLGISRPRLYRRMKELGIADVPEPEDDAGDGGTETQ